MSFWHQAPGTDKLHFSAPRWFRTRVGSPAKFQSNRQQGNDDVKKLVIFATSLLMVISFQAQARDTKHMLSIEEAMESRGYDEKLDAGIQFFFGDESHPAPAERLGEYVSNKKTNAFGKSDEEACQWALLSALISLQERAQQEGGNAVVNIRSYYKKNEHSSETEYECHAGAIMAGVALKGEVVKLPE